ncbi:MAG TPA: hypothetical protein VN366_06890 [Feifaniaceae bacterium]|nr:hypothetical protein [Feifaniaceae bacterium]
MLTIFNRKELMTTYSLDQQAKIRERLSAHNIAYTVKTVGRSDTRGRTGSFGENPAVHYGYIIFVHKNDYEKAQGVLGGHL